ncbi:hypothetical protein BDW66DRAFT_151725 [Aspergillus desertorum]
MNPKQKTAIIVVALVLVPIILACCAFALALGCAEFWSSGRFTLIKPWIRRQLAAVRKQLKPTESEGSRAVKRDIGRNNTAITGTAMAVAEADVTIAYAVHSISDDYSLHNTSTAQPATRSMEGDSC